MEIPDLSTNKEKQRKTENSINKLQTKFITLITDCQERVIGMKMNINMSSSSFYHLKTHHIFSRMRGTFLWFFSYTHAVLDRVFSLLNRIADIYQYLFSNFRLVFNIDLSETLILSEMLTFHL